MTKRTQLVLWIGGVLLLFGLIFLVWAIDTNRISIFAAEEGPIIETASELKTLPSPDQSTFNKLFTAIANLFSR